MTVFELDILQNRYAVVREVRVGHSGAGPDSDRRARVGLLARATDHGDGVSIEIEGDADDAPHMRVPRAAVAPVQTDGVLPKPHGVSILFSAIVGSRAQGMETDASDTDRRGFYLASPEIEFSLDGAPPQLVHDQDQLCYWEVEKFLRLALAANPTVLETLYSPVVDGIAPAIDSDLRALRDDGAFLSRRCHQTFLGYADAQFEKMARARERDGRVKWQHAMHLIRLLQAGAELMRSGTLSVVVTAEARDELLAIKRGECDWDDVCRRRAALVERFNDAAVRSPLPDTPVAARVDAFLVELRRRSVHAASIHDGGAAL